MELVTGARQLLAQRLRQFERVSEGLMVPSNNGNAKFILYSLVTAAY